MNKIKNSVIAALVAAILLTFCAALPVQAQTENQSVVFLWNNTSTDVNGLTVAFQGRPGGDSAVVIDGKKIHWQENNGSKRWSRDNAVSRLSFQEAEVRSAKFRLGQRGICGGFQDPTADNRIVFRSLKSDADIDPRYPFLLEMLRQCGGYYILNLDPRMQLTDDSGRQYRAGEYIQYHQQDGATRWWTPELYLGVSSQPSMRLCVAVDYFGALARNAGETEIDGDVALELELDATATKDGFVPLGRAAAKYRQNSAEYYIRNPWVLANPFGQAKFQVTILENGKARNTGSNDPAVFRILRSCNGLGQCTTVRDAVAYRLLLLQLNWNWGNQSRLDQITLGPGQGWAMFILYLNGHKIVSQDTVVTDFIGYVSTSYVLAWERGDYDAFSDLEYALDVIQRSRGF